MSTLNVEKKSLATLTLDLGGSFLAPNLDTGFVEQKIIISPKLMYGYWSKKKIKALNSGAISQLIYDVITDNENEERQYYTISLDYSLNKAILLDLIAPLNLLFVETEGTAIQILQSLNDNEYQIIKNA